MEQEAENEDVSNLTNIQKFFWGQAVLITGVTGLVGKVVLEKILRCCPGIGMIYIHMRPKKNLTTNQRADKLFNLELFRVLKDVLPNFRKYIKVIEGDIRKPRLGLSFEDFEEIRQNVSVVIHTAASVKFNDPLKTVIEHNVVPIQTILELCHEMSQIKAVVHVSTAYVQREENGTVFEEIPKCKLDPETLMDALKWMDEKCQARVEEYLLDNNWKQIISYMVSKAMAEIIIDKKRGNIPVAIVRPSYICSTWKDPFPGWIDGIQGISGLMLAGAKGILRAVYVKKDLRLFVIPVDVVANAILSSAWHVGTTKPPKAFIVNCVVNFDDSPYVEESLIRNLLEKRDIYPLANMFRYPDVTIYYNRFLYRVHSLVDEWIPALIIDLLLYLFTGKPVLIKIYRMINLSSGVLLKIGEDPWIHRTDNFLALGNKLSEEDKNIFNINVKDLDWREYLDNFFLQGRKFIGREDPSNIPYAKKKAKIWLATTTALKWLFITLLVYYMLPRSAH